jgi:peptidoglycan/LPS O-acetylase OafA/YrhL
VDLESKSVSEKSRGHDQLAAQPYEPRIGTHIPALDALRGMAILLVTVYRFGYAREDPVSMGKLADAALSLGERGVDLFFVLSGFLITGILFDAKAAPHYFRDFYMRRTLRIFPRYFGVLFFSFVLLPVFWRQGDVPFAETAPYQLWLWCYGTNILLAWEHNWELLGSFNHFWSLAVEEHFYLVWPLVIFLCSRRSTMAVCVAGILIAIGLRVYFLVASANYIAVEVLTPCRIDALAIGALLALAIRGPQGFRAVLPWAAVAVVVSTLLLAIVLITKSGCWALSYTIYAAFFGSLIYFCILTPPDTLLGRFANSAIPRFFGKYSYGMYVFQNLLIPILAPWFSPVGLAQSFDSNFVGRLAYLLGMSAATTTVALLSWHLYEKHFLKLKVYFEAPHALAKTAASTT